MTCELSHSLELRNESGKKMSQNEHVRRLTARIAELGRSFPEETKTQIVARALREQRATPQAAPAAPPQPVVPSELAPNDADDGARAAESGGADGAAEAEAAAGVDADADLLSHDDEALAIALSMGAAMGPDDPEMPMLDPAYPSQAAAAAEDGSDDGMPDLVSSSSGEVDEDEDEDNDALALALALSMGVAVGPDGAAAEEDDSDAMPDLIYSSSSSADDEELESSDADSDGEGDLFDFSGLDAADDAARDAARNSGAVLACQGPNAATALGDPAAFKDLGDIRQGEGSFVLTADIIFVRIL